MGESPVTADVVLTDEDYRRLSAALRVRGRPTPQGFAWLIGEGLLHYRRDQEAWATASDGPDARELQRREARAHLLLMRTRAAELDARVAALRETVADLGPRYRQLRAVLFALQRERRALRTAASSAPSDLPPRRPGLVARLREVLRGARWRW